LDWQWKSFLSKQIPAGYVEELRGLGDAGHELGLKDQLNTLVARGITLANFPGDITNNIKWLLFNELHNRIELQEHVNFMGMDSFVNALMLKLEKLRQHCSMFGVWGFRTNNSNFYSMRNLDWHPNTGINTYKLITVFHDEELAIEVGTSRHSYATVGFAGLFGALTGMNDAGLTVHEAGNDVKKETFLGFPWVLRLRHILGNAGNLKEALSIWNQTNNTLGMNHGIGSANDQMFAALETMAGYTAFFFDNDPREANYTVVDDSTGERVRMGWPLKSAVYRTNHGFDPQILSQQLRHLQPSSNSAIRYKILHDAFTYYQNNSILLDDLQAINITSILGDKGPNFFSCQQDSSGINVLSVTYRPKDKLMFTSFEEGGKTSNSAYKPACCSSYVLFDMNKWFIQRSLFQNSKVISHSFKY